jgi:hypothetical protein
VSTLTRVRVWLALFVVGLVLSGVTAFPLEWETRVLLDVLRSDSVPISQHLPGLVAWIERVHQGLADTNAAYPFIAYGTDWLAFAHLVIAIAFWGPLKDPVRNVWVVQFGMISCVAVVPLALIAGPIRGIPAWWTVIDISFGVFGIIPLLFAHAGIRKLAAHQSTSNGSSTPPQAAPPPHGGVA